MSDQPERLPRPRPNPPGQESLLELPAADRPMIGRLHARAGDTEQHAAAANPVGRRTQRVRVLELFQLDNRKVRPNGYTDYEVARILGMRRLHVAGTRREELIRDGHPIVDSGERRPTDTGRNAIVWKLMP